MRSARRQPVWKPLRTAIALLVSRDEAFARSIDKQEPSEELPLQATLPGNLRDAMVTDGALVMTQIGVRASPFGEQPHVEFLQSETYRGRFDRVLQDFRRQKLSFEDFVVARMADAGDWIGHWISAGWLTARHSNGELPAALASTLRLDWEVEFEGGPPRLIMVDAVGRRRRDMVLNWPQLLECVRDHFTSEDDAEPADGVPSTPTGASTNQSGSLTAVNGPGTRPSPVDPLTLEVWPLACVLAWIDGAFNGQPREQRDDVLRKAFQDEARALPRDVMQASRSLLNFAAAHPDRLKLRNPGGIIELSQLGPEAMIFPTMVGSQLTFALRPHVVVQNASDIEIRVPGVWCLAREVRAAWPDMNAAATSPEGIDDIGRWKPTWLSLAGAIMWVVTREARLTKSADQGPKNDHRTITGISVALAMEQFETRQPVGQLVDLHDAWPAIRQMIADEKIAAEGRSVLRVGLTSAVTTTFPNESIPSGEASNLFIDSFVPGIDPKDALAPDEFYRFHNGQGKYWYDVRLRAADVFREFPAKAGAIGSDHAERRIEKPTDQLSAAVRRGRRPIVQNSALRIEAVRLMGHHGAFSDDDFEWNGPEKLILALQKFHSGMFKHEPSRSTLQPHVKKWRAEIDAENADN